MSDAIVILTTCPNHNEAKQLASDLIEKKLAACVQLNPIESFYTWEGNVQIDPEIRLTIKTKTALYGAVETFILKHHSYDIPQIIAIDIDAGYLKYLDWIQSI